MEDILVPIFVCVVLPVAIVAIVFGASMFQDRQRTKILTKAIDNNLSMDVDKLAEALRKPVKTPEEIRNSRLLRGCIFSFIGIVLLAIGIVNWCSGADLQSDNVSVTMMIGGISLAIGGSFMTVYYVTRKQIPQNKD